MQILVTGATGFIGEFLIPKLLSLNYQVSGISLHGGTIGDFEIEALDLNTFNSIDEYLSQRKIDVVIHLAVAIPQSFLETQSTFIPNMQTSFNIITAAAKNHIKKIIYISSCSVYGYKQMEIDEMTTVVPENYYALSKYLGELLCKIPNNKNLKTVILRISAPYGPSLKNKNILTTFIQSAIKTDKIKLLGTGNRGQDFVFIDDVVNVIILSLGKKVEGVFNIASGKTITMNQLAKKIRVLMSDRKIEIIHTGVNDPQEQFSPRYAIQKSMTQLGYKPEIPLEMGLTKVISFFLNL